MAHNQGEEIHGLQDDYDMNYMGDDMDEEYPGRGGDSESDGEEFMDDSVTDTSSSEARKGKDIQGIPWNRFSITRDKYRQTRLEQYRNYENVANSGEDSEKVCKSTRKGGMYYEFWHNTRAVKSTILHFQDNLQMEKVIGRGRE